MSKKEQVKFVRPDAFTDVEEELNAAMAGLDDVNTRIEDLLEGRLDLGENDTDAPTADAEGSQAGHTTAPADSVSDSKGDSDDDEDYEDEEDDEEE